MEARILTKTEVTRNPRDVFEVARLERRPVVVQSYGSTVGAIMPLAANVPPDVAARLVGECYEWLRLRVAAYFDTERDDTLARLKDVSMPRPQEVA